MVSELDNGWCASEDVGSSKGVDCQMVSELDNGWCASENVGPQRGWIMRSHVGWRGDRNILYKGVETSP